MSSVPKSSGRGSAPDLVVEPDQWCRRYVREGVPRDTVVRRLDPTGAELAPHGARGRRAPLPVQRLGTRVAPRHQRGEQSIPIDFLKGAGRPATWDRRSSDRYTLNWEEPLCLVQPLQGRADIVGSATLHILAHVVHPRSMAVHGSTYARHPVATDPLCRMGGAPAKSCRSRRIPSAARLPYRCLAFGDRARTPGAWRLSPPPS